MSRLTDNDRRLGPITWGKAGWNPWRLVFSTGGGNDGDNRNSLTAYAFGYVARVWMPTSIKPWRRWVDTSRYAWASERGGYWDEYPREWGFCLNEGHLTLYLGPQTHDSETTQSWSCFLPWTQWRFVRRSLYDLNGDHFWTEPTGQQVPREKFWEEQERMREAVPKAVFKVRDYDGAELTVTTYIEEREWRFGDKWCKWLSLFRRPKISRSLDIHFDKECGPEKGSWKGGLIGTGIEMLPGELHESAMRRYCEQEHRSKYSRYRVEFIGADK